MAELLEYFTTKTPLFTASKNFSGNNYIVSPDKFVLSHKATDNIGIGIIADSEFVISTATKFNNDEFDLNRPVTIQLKHIHLDDARIFVHKAFEIESEEKGLSVRHPVTKHPFAIGDYLESYGHDVSFDRITYDEMKERGEMPFMLFAVYGFLAVVDIPMLIVDGDYLEDLSKKYAYGQMNMTRRLTCGRSGITKFNWIITIDGFEYQVALKVFDICALHGAASYKQVCSNTGVVLDSKDLMGAGISRMDEMYYEKPADYDDYSKGDLYIYDVLVANAANTRKIYEDLNIGGYYQDPRLTMGATVSQMIEGVIYKLFDLEPEVCYSRDFNKDEFFENKTHKASCDYLSKLINSNAYTLCKAHGGRCCSNNPIITGLQGDLTDIDIGGAYASAMSFLDYPFGTPAVYATKYNKRNNKGIKINKFFKVFENQLVDGLWMLVINTKNLDFEQDLIGSWFDFARNTIKRTDSDEREGEVDVTSGTTKILTNQIINGVLTADLLDVIRQWTPRQQNDFFEKTEVIALAFYPKSLEITVDEFKNNNPEKRFSTRSKELKGFELITQESHSWCRVNLGEFFIDILRSKRNQYDKKDPLNTLLKLFINTSYGVQVSRHFRTSNMIVANQITAMVRAMMYLSEKALNLCGSITDGQVFDLNNVLHRTNGYLKTESLARLYSLSKREVHNYKAGRFAPMDLPDNTPDEINKAALVHVQKVWPNSKLLNDPCKKLIKRKDGAVEYSEGKGRFEFEIKGTFNQVVLHGSSNYSLDPDDKDLTKFRSYESKQEHSAYTLVDGELLATDYYKAKNPAQALFTEIRDNPNSVKRLPPFVKTGILKPTLYAANYQSTWKDSPLQPGDNMLKVGRPTYHSVAQFKYKTCDQYVTWKKCTDSLKRKFDESFEIFFSNPDGTIDYQKMIITLDKMIREGVKNPMKIFDPHEHLDRKALHPIAETYKKTVGHLHQKIIEVMSSEDAEASPAEFNDGSRG